jgi:hypothetical protein
MRLALSAIMLGMLLGTAQTADHSIAIATGGVNLYAITNKGVNLVKGSPFVPSATLFPDQSTPTPVLATMNPAHDFAYVVYEGTAPGSSKDVTILGLKVTDAGLTVEWSNEFVLTGDPTTLSDSTLIAGRNYAVLSYSQNAFNSRQAAQIVNKTGQRIAYFNLDLAWTDLSVYVDPDQNFIYSCYLGTTSSESPPGTPKVPTVMVYKVEDGALAGTAPYPFPLPQLILASSDSVFVPSVCRPLKP